MMIISNIIERKKRTDVGVLMFNSKLYLWAPTLDRFKSSPLYWRAGILDTPGVRDSNEQNEIQN